jgi:N-acetylmuramoyl-L-alanine amidase
MKHLFYCALSACLVYAGFTLESSYFEENEALNPIEVTAELLEVENIDPEPAAADPLSKLDTHQVNCLAQNIYHEARGESYNGKIAVANVTLNRVRSEKFPSTICGVVKQAVYSRWWKETHNRNVPVRHMCQFSWYCDGKSDEIYLTDSHGNIIRDNVQAWEDSLEIAQQAMLGNLADLTDGATHYYNARLANPKWAHHYAHVKTIGNHSFHNMYK